MTKNELRKIYFAKQKSLSAPERNAKSAAIAERFFQQFDARKIEFLHSFLPIEKNNEVDTHLIIKRLWREFPHVETVASRVRFDSLTLDNLKFKMNTPLVKNRWHILEPDGGELLEIERIDLVLVPLLCFDRKGFRVGYGKGFYDKFLSECRPDCAKVGLSFFAPVKEISDAQSFDIKLDFCITPEKTFSFANC